MKKPHPAFCPVCNKGRGNRPLRGSILTETGIEDLTKCSTCGKIFRGYEEVIVEIRKKPKPGQDLRKMIPDWYRCPECREVVAGFMSWAAHTAQKHKMSALEFEQKYGAPEESYYGIGFKEYFNPSKRKESKDV